MYVDSYQVEVQCLTTNEWSMDSCFRIEYRWQFKWRRWLWMPWQKRGNPEIVGDSRVAVLVVKAEAHRHARYTIITQRPRNVRIVRVERQGARLMKFVVWQNGRWFEDWSSNE